MRLDTKMMAGSLIMALACGGAGFYGVHSLGGVLAETTGPAWQSAQGGMKASIEIGAQMLAVKNVLADVDVDRNRKSLEVHRKKAVTALNSMDDAGQLDVQRLDELRRLRSDYEASLSAVMAAFESASSSRRTLDAQTAHFVALAEELEEKIDSAVEQFEQTPDKAITWDTGLQANWDAADGGMHVRIGLLTKLHLVSRLQAGADRDECLKAIQSALAFQEDGFHHLNESGLFQVPVDPGAPNGQTLEAMYEGVFRENTRLMDDYLQQLFSFQDASSRYEIDASGFLGFLNEVEADAAGAIDIIAADAESIQSRAWLAIFVSLLLCVAASAYSALFLGRTIRRPLTATLVALKKIAAGNLTERVEVEATGEMAELVEAVNHITDGYHSTMKHIVSSAETLTNASGELTTTADDLASAADQASHQSGSAATAAEEMSVTMSSVSSMTQGVSSNVSGVAGSIHEMSESIASVAASAEQSARIANRAAVSADESNARVAQLGDAAKEISQVIGVIQDIAEQTNLLALNATIESARAGDSGKGFAVVAQEVKQLAQQTTGATEDIRKRIETVLDTTEQAVKSIEGVGEVISEVNGAAQSIATAVEQQTQVARNVTSSVTEIADSANSLAASISQSAVASSDISRHVAGVDSEAQRTSAGAGAARTASSNLQNLATDLQKMVAGFTV